MTGFTYRGLAPHKFTPMPGVHLSLKRTRGISVKTQFLTPEMHVTIIGLLKYIKEHHLPSLEVNDEGEYWETGDYRKLENMMKLVKEKINYLSRELSSKCLGDMAGLSADEIADRIERLFHAEEVKSGYIH